jgi:hypothetical protein
MEEIIRRMIEEGMIQEVSLEEAQEVDYRKLMVAASDDEETIALAVVPADWKLQLQIDDELVHGVSLYQILPEAA